MVISHIHTSDSVLHDLRAQVAHLTFRYAFTTTSLRAYAIVRRHRSRRWSGVPPQGQIVDPERVASDVSDLLAGVQRKLGNALEPLLDGNR